MSCCHSKDGCGTRKGKKPVWTVCNLKTIIALIIIIYLVVTNK